MATFKYMDWDQKLEELAQKQQVSENPEALLAEFQNLENDIKRTYSDRLQVHSKAGKVAGVGVALTAISIILAALKVSDAIFLPAFLISIGFTVIAFYIRSQLWKRVAEILEFDKKYFDGGLFSKNRN